MNKLRNTEWRVPLLLLSLGMLNIVAGSFQLSALAQGPEPVSGGVGFASPQYFTSPIPIMLHIVSGIVFNLLSPIQFVTSLRERWPLWHRWMGVILFFSGMLAAASALWMNQVFPAFGVGIKYSAVLVFSIGMMLSMVFGLMAVLRGEISCHRIWMIRAVAIGIAPAVQRLLLVPVFLIFGEVNTLLIEIVVCLSFMLNLSIAEWILHLEQRRNRLDEKSLEVKL